MVSKLTFKKSLFFFLLFFLLSPLTSPRNASSADFSSGYEISFIFDASGRARVTQKISLKNKTSNLYASEYSLTIGSTKISEVSGSDRLGGINTTTTTKDGSTVISARLNDKVVGSGKTASLTINYSIDDLAVKHGMIWEVNIPKIASQEEVDGYSLRLSVPEAFGELHSIAPSPSSTEAPSGSRIYVFGKEAAADNISASFGKVQQLKFDLKYHLKNSNLLSGIGTIALPPDKNHQQIFLTSINPLPQKLYTDSDGNYLADFLLKGRTSIDITVAGYVKIADQNETLQKVAPTSAETLQKEIKSDKYWETENAAIQEKAKELKSVREVYDFVVKTLKYNYKRLEQSTPDRLGAARALQEPANAICTDFTDLFIALLRAKGIPAREIEGFAYTDNNETRPTRVGGLAATNILHAWPEYYDKDKSVWVAVDPTWESTTGGVNYFDKLDTDHFAFVIHGESSNWPVPAGGYKTLGKNTNDLKIEFSTDEVNTTAEILVDFDFQKAVGGFPSSGKVTIKNTTGRSLLTPKLTISIPGAKISSGGKISEDAFLPFGTKTYEVKFSAGNFFTTKKQAVKVSLTGFSGKDLVEKEFSEPILLKPFFFSLNPISILTLVVLLLLSGLSIVVFRFLNREKRPENFPPKVS